MSMAPSRDPQPLIDEFKAWQESNQLLLAEWARRYWVAKNFHSQRTCYQFMMYWLNREERLKNKKLAKLFEKKWKKKNGETGRRGKLLQKYAKVLEFCSQRG